MIHVTIPDELADLVANLPADSRQSLDAYLKDAIEEYLWDQQAVVIAEQRLAALDAGAETKVSMDDMMAELGLAR